MGGEKEKSIIEGALVDAELFLKYRLPQKAINTLCNAIKDFPYNGDLRWLLVEIYRDQQMAAEAAQQLIALADIYLSSNQFEMARSALLNASELYPNAPQITLRLTALEQRQATPETPSFEPTRRITPLMGDLRYISLFDVIQALEKNRITGIIYVENNQPVGSIYFNQGVIVDAIYGALRGKAAFKCFAEINEGCFELEPSPVEFQASIIVSSNAQLILEIFSDESEESMES
ncbi:MAG: DUF4388 domain-containing protein [Acidobacteriota bacterium]